MKRIPFALFSILTLFLILFFSTLHFNCTPPKPEIAPALDKAKQDSINQAEQEEYIRYLDLWQSLGRENFKTKQYQRAVNQFWVTAKADTIKRHRSIWTKIFQSYFYLEKPDSAQMAAEMGLEIYPDDLYLHRSIAHLFTVQNEYEKAIEHFKAVLSYQDDTADDWKKLGGLYLATNDLEAAIEAFETAVELNPDDTESIETLTSLYKRTGESEAVVNRLKQLRKQDPKNPKYMYDLGLEYFKREIYEKAELEFTTYLGYKPDDLLARRYLADSQQNQEKYSDAISIYQSIVDRKADDTKALCEIAACLKSQKKFAEGRTYIRRAQKIEPKTGNANLVLGQIYEACADNCVSNNGNKTTFNDKLVYKLAYEQYSLATKDPGYEREAQRFINYVKPMLPTQEDYFMNKNRKQAQGACYRWIY